MMLRLLTYVLYLVIGILTQHYWGWGPFLLLIVSWCLGALYSWEAGWNAAWEYAFDRMPSEKRKHGN